MKRLIVYIISLFCAINAWAQLDNISSKSNLPHSEQLDTNSKLFKEDSFFETNNLDN